MQKIVFISISTLFAFLNILVFTDIWDYGGHILTGLGIIYILLGIYIITRARANYKNNPLLWIIIAMSGFIIFTYLSLPMDKYIFVMLFALISYHLLRERIATHYQFKIFAILMGLLSLIIPLSYIFSWDITEHPLLDVFSQPFIIADAIALTVILLLRTHMWLKLPIALSIIAALIISPQPIGIIGIIAAISIYTILSHDSWKGRLSNFLKVSGFTIVSIIATTILFYPHITLFHGGLSGFPPLSLLFSSEDTIIQNTVFYILLAVILSLNGKNLYDIFSSKAFKDRSIDEIEYNNIIMIVAAMVIIVISASFEPIIILQPIFWLSAGLSCIYRNNATLTKPLQ